MTPTPLFATHEQVEQLADLLEQVLDLQARLVAIVDRLTAPTETAAEFAAVSRPGLRLVE